MTCASLKCPAYTDSSITGRKTCGTLRKEVKDRVPDWCPRMRVASYTDQPKRC
jgi:hypothetical protein